MKVLTEEDSEKVVGIMVGDSTIFIPEGFDPRRELGLFFFDLSPGGVPLNRIRPSLLTWSELTGKLHQWLIEAGQPELARQILPRGGD